MLVQANQPIEIAGQITRPGERRTLEIEMGRLTTHHAIHMPVQVVCGRQKGPVLFVSAAIHGDEVNGVEIIRRLLKSSALKKIRGTLIAVPIVNLHGFIHQSRYLPDRRDLNRSFPGSKNGSMAARIAHVFMEEIVRQSTHGIDLHTGAIHRSNLPQIRANLDDEHTLEMAKAFGAPVVLNSTLRDGSLREAASQNQVPILLYEAGEALRFDELSIRGGLKGILRVMAHLGMIRPLKEKHHITPIMARSSTWVRAPSSGIVRILVKNGTRLLKDKTLVAMVSDPFGENEVSIFAPCGGIVIGQSHLPLVNEGDGIVHIARFHRTDLAQEKIDAYQESLEESYEWTLL